MYKLHNGLNKNVMISWDHLSKINKYKVPILIYAKILIYIRPSETLPFFEYFIVST